MKTLETAVCIVGAGPTGLGLALDLGRRGVEAIVLERRPHTTDRPPTANHVGVRAMEILRRWGVAERVRREGFDPQHGDDRIFVTSVGGHEVYRIRRPANGIDLALKHTPEREVWCPKHDFDRFLEEALAECATVRVHYETEVYGLDPFDREVRLRARRTEGGEIEVRARWVVACDGSRSTVRELAGIPLSADLELPVTLQSVDFHSETLARALPAGWTQCTLLDTGAMIVAIDPVDRFRIHVPAEPGAAPVDAADAQSWLDRIAGRPIHAEVRSVLPWRLTSSLASELRCGRILLAGDAAKRVTPYGGLGANYGLVDVATLGWMLAALERGWGGCRLLDGYALERRSAARRLLEYQGVDFEADPPTMATRLGLPELPGGLEEEGPAGDAARAAQLLAEHNLGHFDNAGVDLDQRADRSPIVATADTPAPPWNPRSYFETSRPGHRAPHRWLGERFSTLDLYDRGFILWRLGEAPGTEPEPLEAAARARGVPLRVVSSSDPEVVAAYECALVLVRPDGIVAWRGERLPGDPAALLDRVRGAAPEAGPDR